jgi:hypothetical protein
VPDLKEDALARDGRHLVAEAELKHAVLGRLEPEHVVLLAPHLVDHTPRGVLHQHVNVQEPAREHLVRAGHLLALGELVHEAPHLARGNAQHQRVGAQGARKHKGTERNRETQHLKSNSSEKKKKKKKKKEKDFFFSLFFFFVFSLNFKTRSMTATATPPLTLARALGAGPPPGADPSARAMCPVGPAALRTVAYTAGARVVLYALDRGVAVAHLAPGPDAAATAPALALVTAARGTVAAAEMHAGRSTARPRIHVWDIGGQGQGCVNVFFFFFFFFFLRLCSFPCLRVCAPKKNKKKTNKKKKAEMVYIYPPTAAASPPRRPFRRRYCPYAR